MAMKFSPELRARVRAELNNALLSFPIRWNPLVEPENRDKWVRFIDAILYEKTLMHDGAQATLDGEPVEDVALATYVRETDYKHLLPQQDAKGARIYYPMLPKVRRSRADEGRALLSALGSGSDTVERAPMGWWTSEARKLAEAKAAAAEAARPRTDRELAERQTQLLEEMNERSKPGEQRVAERREALAQRFTDAARAGALTDDGSGPLGRQLAGGVRAHHEEALAAAREQLAADPTDEAAREDVRRREGQLARLGGGESLIAGESAPST